jgi:hypothetical protein
VLLLLVVAAVVAAVVRNNDSADVGNYTEKEEDIQHPDKTGNNVVAAFVAENMSVVVDVVTLIASSAIAWASAALRLEIVALVVVEEVVAVAVHDYYSLRRCMAIVVKAVEVCHDYLSCWWMRVCCIKSCDWTQVRPPS